MPISPDIAAMHGDIRSWRHQLHAHPETAFQEFRTAEFVAEALRGFGCDEVVTGFGCTGVVGVIHGTGEGPAVALRADMDALPITETTGKTYASKVTGRMHACGHDGHTAMLLGAARHLAASRDFPGRVVLVFQPAEEVGGGSEAMLAAGLIERFPMNRIFGLHNWPGLPEGKFHCREGAIMAAVAALTITITGQGTHGALPEQGVDPILTAAQTISALQGIVARSLSAHDAGVVTIGHVEEAGSWNVIPSEVQLRGTARWFDGAVGTLLEQRIRAVVRGCAAAAGATCSVEFERLGPPVINDPQAARLACASAAEIVGQADVIALPNPVMGADDVGVLMERRPGCYLLLGAGETPALHHPGYDFNDALLPVGAAWLAAVARRSLAQG